MIYNCGSFEIVAYRGRDCDAWTRGRFDTVRQACWASRSSIPGVTLPTRAGINMRYGHSRSMDHSLPRQLEGSHIGIQ